MKFYLTLIVLLVGTVGCMNVSERTVKFDKDGKPTEYTEYVKKERFADKNISALTEVEAFKVTTSPDASGNMLPQVSFGWFWTLVLDEILAPGKEIFFCKTNSHWFVNNNSGVTMLYIKNGSDKNQEVKINSKPKTYIDTPLIKFGSSTNKTDVKITPGAKPGKLTIRSTAVGGNEMKISFPKPQEYDALKFSMPDVHIPKLPSNNKSK